MSNRKILFRGKRLDNKEWIQGYLWIGNDHSYITPDNVGISYYEKEQRIMAVAHEVDPETVCQYTGLTDKNGRKIFEGDIVKHYYNKDEPSCFEIGVILWNEEYCGFYRSSKKDDSFYRVNNYYCVYEIIGNIFDNPELLEVENETN